MRYRWLVVAICAAILTMVSACSGGAQVPASPAASVPAASPSPAPASPSASPSPAPGGPASLTGPAEVAAGASFEVAWTGPNAQGDYITIVAKGATRWTNEPYFYTSAANPGKLAAPTTAGDYELWYVNGPDDTILARNPITVLAFVGTLEAPADVQAGTEFEVAWTGPNGPGDYVTVVAKGATRWTNESYFYTAAGSTGKLTAPVEAGDYEVWYVAGQDSAPKVRRPITVSAVAITLDAPAVVQKGAQFQVSWTGPNLPSDYLTIVPAGAPEGAFTSYAYTASGNPVTLTAPEAAGNYEIRYASDRVAGVFASRPIVVQ